MLGRPEYGVRAVVHRGWEGVFGRKTVVYAENYAVELLDCCADEAGVVSGGADGEAATMHAY